MSKKLPHPPPPRLAMRATCVRIPSPLRARLLLLILLLLATMSSVCRPLSQILPRRSFVKLLGLLPNSIRALPCSSAKAAAVVQATALAVPRIAGAEVSAEERHHVGVKHRSSSIIVPI